MLTNEIVELIDHVKPQDIDPKKIDKEIFGSLETACSAKTLLAWANYHGLWKPFSKAEIDNFSGEIFCFEALIEPRRRVATNKINQKESLALYGGGWIIFGSDGRYHFTRKFVDACYQASQKITSNIKQPA